MSSTQLFCWSTNNCGQTHQLILDTDFIWTRKILWKWMCWDQFDQACFTLLISVAWRLWKSRSDFISKNQHNLSLRKKSSQQLNARQCCKFQQLMVDSSLCCTSSQCRCCSLCFFQTQYWGWIGLVYFPGAVGFIGTNLREREREREREQTLGPKPWNC